MGDLENAGYDQPRTSAEVTMLLPPGAFTVHVVAAFDERGERNAAVALRDDSPFVDRLLFIQRSHCGASGWTDFTNEHLAWCGGNEVIQPELAFTGPSSIVPTKEKEQEGLYMSMLFGGDFATLKKNHLIVRATIILLGASLTIDISFKPGKATEGGGLFAMVLFEWKMGSIDLGMIKVTFDFIPMDFEAMVEKGFEGMVDMALYLSIAVRPSIINLFIIPIEAIIKVILFPIFMIILVLIDLLMVALEIALIICDAAKKALKVVEKELNKFEKKMDRQFNKKSEKENQYLQMERERALPVVFLHR